MATTRIPPDFKEFLRLLNEHRVEYLLIGGYAVSHYGYVRSTADLDVWVAIAQSNAERIVQALRAFGFNPPVLTPQLFLQPEKIFRMGVPPFRLEIHTSVSGLSFEPAYQRRRLDVVDGLEISVICLDDLKNNKRASGRPKDLVDLEHLP